MFSATINLLSTLLSVWRSLKSVSCYNKLYIFVSYNRNKTDQDNHPDKLPIRILSYFKVRKSEIFITYPRMYSILNQITKFWTGRT